MKLRDTKIYDIINFGRTKFEYRVLAHDITKTLVELLSSNSGEQFWEYGSVDCFLVSRNVTKHDIWLSLERKLTDEAL